MKLAVVPLAASLTLIAAALQEEPGRYADYYPPEYDHEQELDYAVDDAAANSDREDRACRLGPGDTLLTLYPLTGFSNGTPQTHFLVVGAGRW